MVQFPPFFSDSVCFRSKSEETNLKPILNKERGYFAIGPEDQEGARFFFFNVFVCYAKFLQSVSVVEIFTSHPHLFSGSWARFTTLLKQNFNYTGVPLSVLPIPRSTHLSVLSKYG